MTVWDKEQKVGNQSDKNNKGYYNLNLEFNKIQIPKYNFQGAEKYG